MNNLLAKFRRLLTQAKRRSSKRNRGGIATTPETPSSPERAGSGSHSSRTELVRAEAVHATPTAKLVDMIMEHVRSCEGPSKVDTVT